MSTFLFLEYAALTLSLCLSLAGCSAVLYLARYAVRRAGRLA